MKWGTRIAWIVGLTLVAWVLIAFIAFQKDAPARKYAEQATTTTAVERPGNDWSLFWWGYMLGGNRYSDYRDTTYTNYRNSPQYQYDNPEPSWGTDDADTSADNGSWGNDWDWSSDSSGSWGSDNDSGWDSSDSGSWGSDYDSGSSWDSGSSGSWDSGSDWSSDSSGSWGE